MLDWVVVLTPVLALAALLLLGFAGCKFEPRPAEPPPEPNEVDIVVRVPTTLTVTEIVFRCVPPGGPLPDDTQPNPTPGSTDGGDNLFSHSCGTPVNGSWTAGCRLTVSPGGANDQATAQFTFTLDGSDTHPVATFQASRNTSGVLTVAFVGLS